MAAVVRKDCRKRLSPKTFTGLFKFGSTEACAQSRMARLTSSHEFGRNNSYKF